MIYKVMRDRSAKPRGFGPLLGYVLQDHKRGFVIHSERMASLRTSAIEMDAVAEMNFRAKRAAYHFSIAWGKEDKPTQREMITCVEEALDTLGLSGHQWVGASHTDAGHDHLHVVANRVHPKTFKCASDSFDYSRLRKLAYRQEMRHGWKLSAQNVGSDVIIDGKTWNYRDLLPTKMSPGAGRSLAFEGKASFQEWLAGEPRTLAFKAVSKRGATWRSLHTALAQVGVRYEKYREGARVFDGSVDHFSGKAGHLGAFATLPKLEKILGPYKPAPSKLALNMSASYNESVALLPPQRDSEELWVAFEKDRARLKSQVATSRRQRWLDQAASEKERRAELKRTLKAALSRAVASGDPIEIQRVSTAAARFTLRRDLAALTTAISIERKQLREELDSTLKPPRWRAWLNAAAKSGNAAAAATINKIQKRQAIPMTPPVDIVPMRQLRLSDMAKAEEVRVNTIIVENEELAKLDAERTIKKINIPTPKIPDLGL